MTFLKNAVIKAWTSVLTINDPEVMKKLEKNGVTLITTDSIEYDK